MFYMLSALKEVFSPFNLFRYITFRAAMASVTTFLLTLALIPVFTRFVRDRKVREHALREDCPDLDRFQKAKEGTPTMGGVMIVGSIAVSVCLWTDLSNPYVLLSLFTLVYLAVLGGIDDYVKLTCRRPGRRGLTKRTKLVWEILLGGFIGSYVYFNPDTPSTLDLPFFKGLWHLGVGYIPFAALVLIATSNAVNMTDGLDGLATGSVAIVAAALALLSYVTGHGTFSQYLWIPFVPGAGELTVFCAAMFGAALGFLWYNGYPASIFMGDTGSLALGGTIGAMAIFIKKELLLLLLGGIFVLEAGSVVLQIVAYRCFRRRIFKISPLHHHLQLCGWPESKIIIRFWIIGIILALVSLVTLKVR